jgi:hypothetical protein
MLYQLTPVAHGGVFSEGNISVLIEMSKLSQPLKPNLLPSNFHYSAPLFPFLFPFPQDGG